MKGITGGLMREAIDLRIKVALRDRASREIDQASPLQ